jgi:hypothetical protein
MTSMPSFFQVRMFTHMHKYLEHVCLCTHTHTLIPIHPIIIYLKGHCPDNFVGMLVGMSTH